MRKSRLFIFSFFLLLATTSCNNDRSDRLSAANVCDSEEDPAAFELSESEAAVYVPATLDFSQISFTSRMYSTIDINDSNGNPASFTFYSKAPSVNSRDVFLLCASGLTLDSNSGGKILHVIPAKKDTERNEVIYQIITTEFGNPTKEDGSDFLLQSFTVGPEEDETGIFQPPPTSYADFFPSDSANIAVYQKKDDKDNLHVYYIHYRNPANGTRVRLTVEVPKS